MVELLARVQQAPELKERVAGLATRLKPLNLTTNVTDFIVVPIVALTTTVLV
jgi:hypothetical protein